MGLSFCVGVKPIKNRFYRWRIECDSGDLEVLRVLLNRQKWSAAHVYIQFAKPSIQIAQPFFGGNIHVMITNNKLGQCKFLHKR